MELLAAIPLIALTGMVALQLLVVGYALTLTDGAAEAGALALATGRPAKGAIEASLPEWAESRTEVAIGGGEVTVRLRPPSLIAAVAKSLTVTSHGYARPAER